MGHVCSARHWISPSLLYATLFLLHCNSVLYIHRWPDPFSRGRLSSLIDDALHEKRVWLLETIKHPVSFNGLIPSLLEVRKMRKYNLTATNPQEYSYRYTHAITQCVT